MHSIRGASFKASIPFDYTGDRLAGGNQEGEIRTGIVIGWQAIAIFAWVTASGAQLANLEVACKLRVLFAWNADRTLRCQACCRQDEEESLWTWIVARRPPNAGGFIPTGGSQTRAGRVKRDVVNVVGMASQQTYRFACWYVP